MNSNPIDNFSPESVGLLFAGLAGLLFVLAYFRSRHSRHDFADRTKEDPTFEAVIITHGQTGKRIFGRPFVTAGWVVVGVSVIVITMEITLLVLVLQI